MDTQFLIQTQLFLGFEADMNDDYGILVNLTMLKDYQTDWFLTLNLIKVIDQHNIGLSWMSAEDDGDIRMARPALRTREVQVGQISCGGPRMSMA